MAGDLAEQDPGVRLPGQDLARGRRDLALAEDAGRDLVEQRLEEVVAGPRDHGDVDVRALERLGAEEPSEARTDHHDLVPTAACHVSHVSTMPPSPRRDNSRGHLVTHTVAWGIWELLCVMRFQRAEVRVHEQGLARSARLTMWRHSAAEPTGAEPLAPGPRGALQARRWVAGRSRRSVGPELRDNAELALSEVVTNAILHGRPPVTVRLRGTASHPRVEVRDASPEQPAFPEVEVGQEFLGDLPTFGRGLAIVASTSEAWGAERDGEGKLVWFVPSTTPPARRRPECCQGWEDEVDETPVAGGPSSPSTSCTFRPGPCRARSPTAPSCGASCGCWPWPIRTPTRSPPTSRLLHRTRARLPGSARRRAAAGALQTGRSHLDLEIKAPLDTEQRFESAAPSCSTSRTRSAATSGCSPWPAPTSRSSSRSGCSVSSSARAGARSPCRGATTQASLWRAHP